jgi:general secretion pathway protein I
MYREEKGFTVLEIAIALAILSLSLAVLFEASTKSLTLLASSDAKARATMIAQSRLAELRATGISDETPSFGTDPSGLTWRFTFEPSDHSPLVQLVTLTISASEEATAPSILTVHTAIFVDNGQHE